MLGMNEKTLHFFPEDFLCAEESNHMLWNRFDHNNLLLALLYNLFYVLFFYVEYVMKFEAHMLSERGCGSVFSGVNWRLLILDLKVE